MDRADREAYVSRYRSRLDTYGYSPKTLGWGENGRQEVRFAILAEHALRQPQSSVLDCGCGFADLYDFLRAQGWHGAYTGIDIVPELLVVARQRHPDLDVRELDITTDRRTLEEHDFVIASGVLNARLAVGDNEAHIRAALRGMHALARVAVSVDFLSTYVDFQKPDAWHTSPEWALAEAKRLSRRVMLRHDYMPYEFAVTIFKNDRVSDRNVFGAFERSLPGAGRESSGGADAS